MAHILIVDDEESICWALQRMLSEQHDVSVAATAEEAIDIVGQRPVDLVLLDVRLPGKGGLEVLPDMRRLQAGLPVIVMTAFGDLQTAITAVERGAIEYITKPFNLNEVRAAIQRGLEPAPGHAPPPPSQPTRSRQPELVGSSPAIQHAFKQIALVARSSLSVLITGETGTGKELVAEAIHRHSDRRDAAYYPIAPVALNENLIESELFGHVRGAFTGAVEHRAGLFEKADGGTVLLDEIAELPLGMQAKLLRVLEKGEFFRVGDVKPLYCDVRILAATNKDLGQCVQEGTFREDLFYRLNGMHIHLPPLRERVEDILPLTQYFLHRIGYPHAVDVDDELLDHLRKRPWYGNVRELKHAVERAAIVARGRPLKIADFPPPQAPGPSSSPQKPSVTAQLRRAARAWIEAQLEAEDPESLLSRLHGTIEPVVLQAVLQHVGNNRVHAARVLGIHRGTLREKLRSLESPQERDTGNG
ncbi:MAG: sigma-54-dependent Fis family transcriptional regulator [Pirellulaceae bacterium]|nr:MAG: sigma-54-dependent Fis family transcriptional regulator [Pirellulaceae bacterium]